MLAVRRLPRRLENFLTTAYKKGRQHRGDNSFLIPELTWVHSFGASIYESALLLPSILCRLSQVLIAKDLNDRVFRGALDTYQTVIAMTGPTAQHPVHYQRHEYLGDALLKSHVSAYVFAISDQRVEGQLHLHRREIVSNINLIEKTKHLNLGTMLYTRSFTRRNWTPPLCRIKGRTVHTGDIVQHISPKMVADVVESVIGAAVLTSDRPLLRSSQVSYIGTPLCMNVDLGLQAIVDFGLLPPHCNTFEKVNKLWTDQVWPKRIAEKWDQRLHAGALHNLETQIGYKFNTPHLALESMTHASHLSSLLPSYQRLEFLGDALLDFMINCWLFQKYPNINEGQLTTLKDLAVCNQAICALSVYLKLHKFLQMGIQAPFAAALSDLTMDLSVTRKAADAWLDRESEQGTSEAVSPDESAVPSPSPSPTLQQGAKENEEPPLIHYWADVREIKALADLVESLLGAVFVDSGFSMEATWNFFSRFYLPWFERYCNYDAFVQRTRHDREKGQKGAEKLSPVIRAKQRVKEKQIRVDELRQDEEERDDDMDDDSDEDMGFDA
jgi:dsRNA-specific ribonuclease